MIQRFSEFKTFYSVSEEIICLTRSLGALQNPSMGPNFLEAELQLVLLHPRCLTTRTA
jgi:hypothetical protein